MNTPPNSPRINRCCKYCNNPMPPKLKRRTSSGYNEFCGSVCSHRFTEEQVKRNGKTDTINVINDNYEYDINELYD